ncbi:beta galactosidase [Zychaea mexicana]|uniref:beta galactosidase n=1 Tax=Zychaea mexicana TaxID=64656 RepID=UPI0022FF0229|nr:beta galactosidase [Zychaea mexicana]KAI9497041.1 beta galactosidase [Zychaea mexicana]
MLLKGVLTSISLAITAITSTSAVPVGHSFEGRQEDGPVTWDTHNLIVNGERLFLFSGEFHYYRLPSPGLWFDIAEKFKALEFNGISFYFDWGYHSPKKGVYDFNGVRNVQKAFDAAKAADLHVITRAGPYINAEVDCGGFPGWLVNQYDMARKSNPENDANSAEWLEAIDKFLVPNQITKGGNIILNQIDNEYADNVDENYMEMIKNKFKEDGMDVPTIFNDIGSPNGNWITGPGSVDIYGWDSYPLGFDCANPTVWQNNRSTHWRDMHELLNPDQPFALYEFQGGAFDPWGGPGYDACRQLVNEQYAKVYYKNNYGQGATIQNLYMTYGGTSWGGLAKPSVYTSYDYGAPISEPGLMTPKGYEVKLQGTFFHTVKPFLTTERFEPKSDNSDIILIDGLADVNTNTKFYIAQHWDTASEEKDEFHITMETSDGTFEVPQDGKLILNGRDAKILTSDYDFNSHHLVYSTSEIFTHQAMGSHDVILVYAYEEEDGEFAIKVKNDKRVKVETEDESVSHSVDNGILTLNYKHPDGTTPIYISGAGKDLLVLVAGYSSATRWWAPITDAKKNERVLIQGPYLVRSAEVKGRTVAFKGDIDETTDIQIVAPESIRSFTWNGKEISMSPTGHGTWSGTLDFGNPEVKYTDLSEATWKYSPGAPESQPDFDDSDWIKANRTKSNSVTIPDTWPILYADDYGYHTGNIWFRGTFQGTSQITGFNLTCHSGAASAWIVWLNGHYLGGFDVGNQDFTNLNGTLIDPEGENIISILLWTTGHEDDWNADDNYKQARGFTKSELLGVSNQTIWSIDWRIQGNLGGEDLADPVRGPYNEGGLFGERNGWHLPGFPDDDWEEASIPESENRTGVSWYRTTFEMDIPQGYDAPMSLRFEDDSKARYRSLVFLNGWQLGRYANDLGPQTQYYLPKGILNTSGENTLAIAVIAVDEAAQIGKVILEPYTILESGIPEAELVESPSYSDRTQ